MILTIILSMIAAALYDLIKIAIAKVKKKLSGRTQQMIVLLWIIMHSLTTIAAAAILVVFHFKGFGEYQVMLDLLMPTFPYFVEAPARTQRAEAVTLAL